MHTKPTHLCLYENVLHLVYVGAVVEQLPHEVAEGDALAGAPREAVDALVLAAHGDQVAHAWRGAALRYRAQELTALKVRVCME